jgi:LysR family hydrogen peroxide-inducible transcriptional activator
MTLQQLRYITALAEIRHFAKAAEACHVSQSTLSIQLKKLEDYLGVILFDRSLRRVTPTPLGREILTRAQNLLREADQIRALAKTQRSDPMDQTLRLGAIPTVAPYLLPQVLPMVHRIHPKLRLLLRELTTDKLLEELHVGKLDAALLSPPVPGAGLNMLQLYREAFVAALPADSPLAKRKTLDIGDLSQEHLLLLEEGHCFREQALAVCGENRSYNEEIKATSLEMLRQMVACGIGSTLLPALAARAPSGRQGASRVVLLPLAAPVPGRDIALVWRSRGTLDETLKRLGETFLSYLPEGVTQLPDVAAARRK